MFSSFFSSIFPIIFFVLLKKNKQKIWQMRSFSNIGSFFHGVNWILFYNSNLQISFQYHHSKKGSFNIYSYSIFKKRSFMFCMPIRDISSSVLCKKSFNSNWHELRKQENCSSLAPSRSKFYKTQWAGCQIIPIYLNFHLQKCL